MSNNPLHVPVHLLVAFDLLQWGSLGKSSALFYHCQCKGVFMALAYRLPPPSFSPYCPAVSAMMPKYAVIDLALCAISISMVRMKTMKAARLFFFKALGALAQYAHKRVESSKLPPPEATPFDEVCPPVEFPSWYIEQEIIYNYGRVYHAVGLLSIALEFYTAALEIADRNASEGNVCVTQEAALNAVQLYSQLGFPREAAALVDKYLVIEAKTEAPGDRTELESMQV